MDPSPVEYQTAKYDDVQDGPSIVLVPGVVSPPESLVLLEPTTLSAEMQTVIEAACDIYASRLISTTIVSDEQPRLLLVFRAAIPHGAATLRVNLGKVGNEVANGLHPNVLRQALNFLKSG